MITYTLPFMILLHFVLLSLVVLGSGMIGFTNKKRKMITFIGYGITLFATILIFVIVFFPFPVDAEEISFNIENQYGQMNNFIPFKSIFFYIKDAVSGYYSTFMRQVLGNIILFFPYGVGLYIFLSNNQKKLFKTIILSFLTSISIEIMQGVYSLLLGYTYRSIDFDDLILNTLGGIAGYFTVKLLYLFLFPKAKQHN